jgi:hypothetical protein
LTLSKDVTGSTEGKISMYEIKTGVYTGLRSLIEVAMTSSTCRLWALCRTVHRTFSILTTSS